MASVHLADNSNISFDLIPANIESESSGKHKRKRQLAVYDSGSNLYVLKKVNFDQNQLLKGLSYFGTCRPYLKIANIFRFQEKIVDKLQKKSRTKRALNNNPISLYVEYLVVAECTIYQNMAALLGSSNQNQIFSFMKVYFAHLINGA
jgi:hypothetical protein